MTGRGGNSPDSSSCLCVSAALPVPDVDGRVLAAVVQETIFSQLLRLPHTELGVLAYAKVTVSAPAPGLECSAWSPSTSCQKETQH